MGPYGYNNGNGDWLAWGLMAFLLVLLILGLISWIASGLMHRHDHDYRHHHWGSNPWYQPEPPKTPPAHDAAQILDQRFARGEIDADEYQTRRKLLRDETKD